MNVLVKITADLGAVNQRRYTPVEDVEKSAQIIANKKRKTPWLCHECSAFSYGDSLYALISPDCKVHRHVLP